MVDDDWINFKKNFPHPIEAMELMIRIEREEDALIISDLIHLYMDAVVKIYLLEKENMMRK